MSFIDPEGLMFSLPRDWRLPNDEPIKVDLSVDGYLVEMATRAGEAIGHRKEQIILELLTKRIN